MIDDQITEDGTKANTASKRFAASVKELIVYRHAYRVSLVIHRTSLAFPKIEQYALADQLRRASKSICAHLSEGFAKQNHSSAEFGRSVAMALGSAGEMLTWIDYCCDLQYISNELADEWRQEYQSIIKMLQKLRINIS